MNQTSGFAPTTEPPVAFMAAVWTTLLLAFYRELAGMPTLAMLGNFNFTIVEALLVVVGASAFLGPKTTKPWSGWPAKLTVCFALLYSVALLRGLLTTPYDAITSMRLNAALPVILIWSLLAPPQMLWHRRVQRAVVVVGTLLGAIVAMRVVMGPSFLMALQDVNSQDINDGGRALSAQGSIMLVSAVVLLIARGIRSFPSDRIGALRDLWLGSILAVMEILTKQGTASLALFAAVGVVIAATPSRGRPFRAIAMGMLCALAGFALLMAQDPAVLNDVNNMLPPSMQFDLDHRGKTFETRQLVWTGLLNDMDTWSETSRWIGLPAGTKPTIWIPLWGGTYWGFSIHNMYYGLLPIMGMIGAGLYVALLSFMALGTMRRIVHGSSEDQFVATVALAWLLVVTVLGFSYEIRNENALLLAMALAATAGRRPFRAATDVTSRPEEQQQLRQAATHIRRSSYRRPTRSLPVKQDLTQHRG